MQNANPFLVPLEKIALSQDDLTAAATAIFTTYDQTLMNASADITFAVADLKYNNGALKIVECGNGPRCTPAGHPVFINNNIHTQMTPYWNIVEQTLSTYKIPIIFAGTPPFAQFNYFANHKTAKRYPRSFAELPTIDLFKTTASKNHSKPKQIAMHQGIVLYRAAHKNVQKTFALTDFKKNYPAFLLINDHSDHHLARKDTTYKLFDDAQLSNYIPRYAIYPAHYQHSLASQIVQELGPEAMFIIKPVAQTYALGVGLASAENLDAHLKHMFGFDPIKEHEAKSIGYWRTTQDTHFLVSEYVPSQIIAHEGKCYDPTMRIAFLMTHECGKITVNVFGGYWKIPPASLDNEQASLTDRHITDPERMENNGLLLIEEHDLKTMKNVVAPILGQMYVTLLKKSIPQ